MIANRFRIIVDKVILPNTFNSESKSLIIQQLITKCASSQFKRCCTNLYKVCNNKL